MNSVIQAEQQVEHVLSKFYDEINRYYLTSLIINDYIHSLRNQVMNHPRKNLGDFYAELMIFHDYLLQQWIETDFPEEDFELKWAPYFRGLLRAVGDLRYLRDTELN